DLPPTVQRQEGCRRHLERTHRPDPHARPGADLPLPSRHGIGDGAVRELRWRRHRRGARPPDVRHAGGMGHRGEDPGPRRGRALVQPLSHALPAPGGRL
ncbi:MAG: hypothetical protein AVDCRST_MAG29-2658, partial [uncultured Nocardioidaceae bacterium]